MPARARGDPRVPLKGVCCKPVLARRSGDGYSKCDSIFFNTLRKQAPLVFGSSTVVLPPRLLCSAGMAKAWWLLISAQQNEMRDFVT